jgi:ADP-ribosyl-[dinitrogen reductase] hydrolase
MPEIKSAKVDDGHGFASLIHGHVPNAKLGGIVGLLVGDCLGVPYEFHPPENLPPRDQIEMIPPAGFHRSHPSVPPGTWSDDGAQALCLLASLIETGKFCIDDFSGRLLRWLDHGYMAVDGKVFDVGNQTYAALTNLRSGISPMLSGGRSEMDNGNGSLSRVLPLALWSTGTDAQLVSDAHLQSMPTHAHPRSMVTCAFYCLVARGYLKMMPDPWQRSDRRMQEIYSDWPDVDERRLLLDELTMLRNYPRRHRPTGAGYVLDTIWSLRKCMEEETFEDVVRTAIMFGNDTDTTACVAGGLAGIKFGIAGIPERWLEELRGFELVEPMIQSH